MAAVSRTTAASADKLKKVRDDLAELNDFASRERFATDPVTRNTGATRR
jgi:hypothetical protein